MSIQRICRAAPDVNIPQAGPLDRNCTALAILAHDLAQVARQRRTAPWARAAVAAEQAAIAIHRLDAALDAALDALLADEPHGEVVA